MIVGQAGIARTLSAARLASRLGDVVRNRHVLAELVRKEFDTRYAGSVLGVLWTQVYPLMLLAVYVFVFTTIFPTNTSHLPLSLFVGLTVWHFFATATMLSTTSILANATLVSNLAFPRELLTIAAVLVPLVDLAMSHTILLLGAVVFGIAPTWSWAALPPLLALLVVFCIGAGLVLATAHVFLRDTRFFAEVGVLLLMFLSAVFYTEAQVPESSAWLMKVNPLAVVITSYRGAFLDGLWPPLSAWATLILLAAVALWAGVSVFDRYEKRFHDAV